MCTQKEVCEEFLEDIVIEDDVVEGWIKEEFTYESFINSLKAVGCPYIVRHSQQNDLNRFKGGNPAIRFDRTSGLPYLNSQCVYFQCVRGDKYYNTKTKHEDEPDTKKSRVQITKKLGCPSRLVVKQRYVFIENMYQGKKTIYYKKKISEDLRKRMTSDEQNPETEVWYFIKISLTHNHSITAEIADVYKMYKSILEEYKQIPNFLQNRPPSYISHVMPRYTCASIEFTVSDIEVLADSSKSLVSVKTPDTLESNIVDFNNVTCDCADFIKWKEICKHFCACFLYLPEFSFDRLPQEYKSNPNHDITIFSVASEFEVESASTSDTEVDNTIKSRKNRDHLRVLLKSCIEMSYSLPDDDISDLIQKASELKKTIENRLKKSIDDSIVQPNSGGKPFNAVS